MKKTLFRSALAIGTMVFALTGCGKTAEKSSPATSAQEESSAASVQSSAQESSVTPEVSLTLEKSFISSSIESPASYGSSSWNAFGYELKLYSGNLYELITTEITYGYSMNLSTTVIDAFGTYTAGASEDGVDSYTLNKADDVIFNAYSKAGGFALSVNTASADQTYPTELLAKTQGEKNMAQSKEDVVTEYGLGYVVYCTSNTLSFVDPNAESSEQTIKRVETASGSAAALKAASVQKAQIVSTIVSPASYGDSSWSAKAYYITTLADNTYRYTTTEVTYGYSMNLSTTVVDNVGTATYGTGEDGYTPLTLSAATDVLFNAYSKAGGFNLSINTASADQTYPTEMMAHNQGEKNMAQSKADVVAEYGPELKVWTSDDSCTLSLVDPNAEN